MTTEAEYATTSGRDALNSAHATLRHALAELDRYIASYDEVENLKDKAKVLNWALNHLATYIPINMRLDRIAGAQAELISANVRNGIPMLHHNKPEISPPAGPTRPGL